MGVALADSDAGGKQKQKFEDDWFLQTLAMYLLLAILLTNAFFYIKLLVILFLVLVSIHFINYVF